jgi:hypothetical protein
LASEYFAPLALSQTVAQEVTSLPVPAVEGAAMIGVMRRVLSGARETRCSRTVANEPSLAARTFAASMIEPPPSAMMTSGAGVTLA